MHAIWWKCRARRPGPRPRRSRPPSEHRVPRVRSGPDESSESAALAVDAASDATTSASSPGGVSRTSKRPAEPDGGVRGLNRRRARGRRAREAEGVRGPPEDARARQPHRDARDDRGRRQSRRSARRDVRPNQSGTAQFEHTPRPRVARRDQCSERPSDGDLGRTPPRPMRRGRNLAYTPRFAMPVRRALAMALPAPRRIYVRLVARVRPVRGDCRRRAPGVRALPPPLAVRTRHVHETEQVERNCHYTLPDERNTEDGESDWHPPSAKSPRFERCSA